MAVHWSSVCVVAVALLGYLCNAQFNTIKRPFYPTARPGYPGFKDPTQVKEEFGKPLTWVYPPDPLADTDVFGTVNVVNPTPAHSVAIDCGENRIHVEVKRDMFGSGLLIQSSDIRMGSCGVVSEDAQVLIFESELQGCGSTLQMVEDSLIYTFLVIYIPQHMGNTPVVRTGSASVTVECHYQRKHNVSSNPLNPLWIPFSATKVAEELLYFSLKLMTSDWMYVRPINKYFMGDLIMIEATVKQYFHVPLRVYVDSCVASATPDVNSVPSYRFLDNYGCMVDAKLTDSKSSFMPRTVDNKIFFQLEAFKFMEAGDGGHKGGVKTSGGWGGGGGGGGGSDDDTLIYITCQLKATLAAYPVDGTHKACSYFNGWREAGGNDAACGCCDTACGGYRTVRDVSRGGDSTPTDTYVATATIAVNVGEMR